MRRITGVVAGPFSGLAVVGSLVVVLGLTAVGHEAPAPDASTAPAIAAFVDPRLAVIQGIAQWATYGGLVLAGSLPFARLVAPTHRDNRRVLVLVAIGCATLAVAAVAELLLFGPIATGRGSAAIGDADLLATTVATAPGRLLLLLAAAALLFVQVAARLLSVAGPAPGLENLGIGLGLVLVVSVAAKGHAGGHALVPAVAHTAGMALWFGSLLAAVVLPGTLSSGADPGRCRLLSRVAAACLYMVVASGVVLAWQLVPSVGELVASDYGRTLLLKLGLVAVLGAAAAVARGMVHTGRPAVLAPLGSLRSVAVVELVIAACVLGVTARLGSLPPPGG